MFPIEICSVDFENFPPFLGGSSRKFDLFSNFLNLPRPAAGATLFLTQSTAGAAEIRFKKKNRNFLDLPNSKKVGC